MRRILSSILSLTVFIFLQYGNIASYYYCKWQAEQRQKLIDCGCEIHLESVFGGGQHEDGITTPDVKLSVIDLTISKTVLAPVVLTGTISTNRITYNTSTLEGFSVLPFHPPIA